MPATSNNFRLTAYIGAGAIFIGLLALVIFGFPDAKLKAPVAFEEDEKKAKKSHRARLPDHSRSAKKISTPSEITDGEEEDDASLPREVIIRGKSKEELTKIFTKALESGGNFKGLIKELYAARIEFPSREAAEKFRDSLGDGDYSDSNYVVMAPDFPTDDDLAGRTPTTGDGGTRTTTTSEGLQPFGDRALEFLGITEDNSAWGRDLTIGILDSGVYAHESLAGINIRQIDLVQTPEDPQADYTGHGTGVADIAHLVAPSADLLSVRVLDSEGIGDTFTVAQGVIAAADNGANVINLSLGSYGDSAVLRDAIDYAIDKGAIIVAASGNDGIEQVSYPAAYENVIGVTAVDASGAFADFSNTGDGVDIGAPGVGVHSAWGEEGQVQFSGTSAASPFVAGAIAAMVTLNPGYTISQAAEQMQASAEDTGAVGDDPQTGSGILSFK